MCVYQADGLYKKNKNYNILFHDHLVICCFKSMHCTSLGSSYDQSHNNHKHISDVTMDELSLTRVSLITILLSEFTYGFSFLGLSQSAL